MSTETVAFLALFASIALAGFNSGNNLLYIIAGVMLSIILLSVATGFLNLSKIKVERRLPRYVFAGQPFKSVLEVSNLKKSLNSYGMEIIGGAGAGLLFIPLVKGQGKVAKTVEMSVSRRGLHYLEPVVIASRFPWGLFEIKKTKTAGESILAYPAIHELNKIINGSSRMQDEFPQFSKGAGSGLYGVREYRHGEDIANISWKLSAKLDKLIVRETEAEERKRVCLVFDNTLEGQSDVDLESFERTVSAAASLIWHLSRKNYLVKLVTRDKIIGYGGGNEQLHKMLTVLALIQPTSADKKAMHLDRTLLEGATGVLIRCNGVSSSISSQNKDFSVEISEKARAGRI